LTLTLAAATINIKKHGQMEAFGQLGAVVLRPGGNVETKA